MDNVELVSFNPATGKDIGSVAASDPGDIQRKVDALRARLPAADLRTRIGWVRSAAEKIRENVDNLARLMTEEQGKPLKESKGEVANAAVRLDYFCETAPAALAPVETDLGNALSVTRFQPIGVIGAIKPWNFPVTIPLWTIGPAILAGNAKENSVNKLSTTRPSTRPFKRSRARSSRSGPWEGK